MVKDRLAHRLEDWLMNTQFEFRKGKSTGRAFFSPDIFKAYAAYLKHPVKPLTRLIMIDLWNAYVD